MGTPNIAFPDEAREVYAWLGYGLHQAQYVESLLAIVVVLAKVVPLAASGQDDEESVAKFRAELVRIVEDDGGQPLGALKDRLSKLGFPKWGLDVLTEANKQRRYLVHHFLRAPERVQVLKSEAGRAALIDELKKLCATLQDATAILALPLANLIRAAGIDGSVLAQRAAALRAGAEGGPLAEAARARFEAEGVGEFAELIDQLLAAPSGG